MINNIEPYMVNENHIEIVINGEVFIFDKPGFKEFMIHFNVPGYDITIIEGYLARVSEQDYDNSTFFHRWLKKRRTSQEWCKEYHIHHINGNKKDNRMRNLQMVSEELHTDIHTERSKKNRVKSAYNTYRRKFFESNPDASPKSMSYHWSKFKKRNIDE